MPSYRGWRLKFSSSLKSDYVEKVPFQNRCASCVYPESHLLVFMTDFFIYYLHLLYVVQPKAMWGRKQKSAWDL